MIEATALFVSIVSLSVAVLALRHQRKHNELSVRPFAEVTADNFEEHIEVRISNAGFGPLILKELSASNSVVEYAPSLYECMSEPSAPACITYYSINLEGRVIGHGESLTLIRIEFDDSEEVDEHEHSESVREDKHYEAESGDVNELFFEALEQCRSELSEYVISVRFTDLYENVFPTYTKKLSVFEAAS